MTSTKISRGSAGAKLVDESHMKTLRELVQLQGNRHCFECAQRGPTYVDVTIGSFICMTCSGLLRGITPPHRVKSISMATFTPDEIQLLRSRGNEYCRKVWLATYTARDSNLSSTTDGDSDRRNALKSHMSAKYEQKRYYVDPSKIPDLHTQTAAETQRTLAGASSSGGSSSSVSNRSPSLSSASSGCSLSHGVHTNGISNNTPSPIMNNLRNSSGNSCPSTNGSNRLVSSQTMPDIKPLSSLLNTGSIQPINFINNLSPPYPNQQHDDKIINTNPPKDPWGGDAGMNGFNANFANFDEAFSSPSSGSNGNFDPFSNSSSGKGNVKDGSDNHGISFGGGFPTNFDKPLLPLSSHQHQGGINHGLTNGHGHHPVVGIMGAGDRYAALKDLDEIFKQGSDSVEIAKNTNPPPASSTSSHTHTHDGVGGLSNSISMPGNLSSALGSGNGWSPMLSNQHPVPNPFSMFGTSPSGSSANNGWGQRNQHNPFSASSSTAPQPSWSSPPQNSSPFGPSHGSNNFHNFGSSSASAAKPMFNPFAATTAPSSNPHNPFL